MNQKSRVTKELNEKHRKILEGLLKLPENRECADCKSKGPRWASINLGIFICMQCSGIHRSLGVHISKVRSATLDTWLPDQIAYIQTMGNMKSNSYWEAELPPKYDRVGMENFIRAKYERKRWVSKERKVELHSSVIREDNVPVYKPEPTTISVTKAIVLLPEQKQSPPLYSSNKSIPSKQVILEPKQIEPESKPAEINSDRKATDLFDILSVNNNITENGSKTSSSDNNQQTRIQTSGAMLLEDNDPKSSSKEKQTKSEFEDLFEGLDWVAPALTQQPCNEVKNDIINLSEKSAMASSFCNRQQLAIHAQQQSRPAVNLQNGVNGFHHAPNQARFSQTGNIKASQPIGNPGLYATSSIYSPNPNPNPIGMSTKNLGINRKSSTAMGPLSIPTQLGGEYDFSSLTQGMFMRR